MRRSVVLPTRSFAWSRGRPTGGGSVLAQDLVLCFETPSDQIDSAMRQVVRKVISRLPPHQVIVGQVCVGLLDGLHSGHRIPFTSRSWAVPKFRATRPLACGECAAIHTIPSSCKARPICVGGSFFGSFSTPPSSRFRFSAQPVVLTGVPLHQLPASAPPRPPHVYLLYLLLLGGHSLPRIIHCRTGLEGIIIELQGVG